MRKSIQKNDRPERRPDFTLSPLMTGLKQAFGMFRGQSKPLSVTPAKQNQDPNTHSSIRFEAIEPRVLLSGDVNPAALTITGNISVQGEQDHYEFTVQDPHRVVFDSLTNRSDLNWQLEGPSGQVANRNFGDTFSPALELAAGQYKLTVDGQQDAIGDYSLRIIDADAAADLTPGTAVNAMLDVGSKTAVYKFTATEGDNFYFKTGGISASADWRLIDPYGRQEGSTYNLGYDRDTFAAQYSGEYLLLVQGAASNSSTLSYQFNLQPVGNSTETLALNAVATANIDQAGKKANFTFDISEATAVSFDRLTDVDFLWSLTGPQGTHVADHYSYQSFDGSERLVLTPGGYTLSVDLNGSNTGSIPFRLLTETSAQPLTLGTAITGILDLARGSTSYRVSLTEGDKLFFDGRSVAGGSIDWRLIDPYGVRLAGSSLTSAINPFTAKVSGDYWLFLDGAVSNAANASVSYDFSLNVVPEIIKTLSIGQSVSDSIPTAGQTVVYEFNLATTTQLVFDSQSNRSDLLWSLTGPRGAEVTDRYFSQYEYQNSILALPAGTYRLVVKGSGNAVGAFSFNLLDLANATVITLDTPVTGSLEPGNSTKAYRLDAVAGQKIAFHSNSVTGGSATWRLIDRFGRTAANPLSLSSNSTEITLDSGGAYSLLVEGAPETTTPINFNIQLNAIGNVTPVVLPDGELLNFGSVVAGSLLTWDTTKVYRFTLGSDKQIVMDAQNNNSSVVWSLVGPRGNEINLQSLYVSDANYTYPVLNLLAGDYVLTLKGASYSGGYAGSGAYAFQLLDTTTVQPLTLGQQVSATRSPANSTLGFRVNATAGSNLVLNKTDSNGGVWRLVDPYGVEVAGFSSASIGTTYSIHATGEYTLLNEGYYWATGTSNITLTLSEQTSASHDLIFNDQMTGSLAGRQSIAEYGFILGDPLTTIVWDALDTTSANAANLQWRLSGPKGVVSNWGSFTSDSNSSAIKALPAGRYTIALRNTQDVSADYKFRVLGTVAATVMQPGISVNDISDVGQTKLYRFNANAGARYYFDGQNNYSGANEYNAWYLVDPFGRNVTSGVTYNDIQDIALTMTGEYLLAVFPLTSSYSPANTPRNIKFNLVPKEVTTAALTLNESVVGSIAQPGQTVKYSFTLASPTSLVIDTGAESNAGALWSLTGPRGSEASLRNFDNTQATVMSLPAGNYEFTVNRTDLATETFNFRLLELSHLPELTINQSTHPTLTADRYNQAYQFNVVENGKFLFNPETFDNSRAWRIVNSLGNTVSSGSMSNASEPFALVKGQYIFIVDGSQNQDSTADFSVLQYSLKTTAILLDTDVLGALDVQGQRAEYDFHVNAATTILFDSLAENPDIRLQLIGPNGTVFSGRSLGSFETYASTLALSVAGDYKLIVSSVNNSVADFGFRLYDLSAMPSQNLPGAQTLNLNPGNSTRLYAFDALAGDYLTFKSTGLNAGQVNMYVINEQGGIEVSPQDALYDFSVTLSASKKYYLVLEGSGSNTAPLEFSVDAHLAGNDIFPLTLDTEVSGAIESLRVTDTWNFTLASQTNILVNGQADSAVAWSIYDDSDRLIASENTLGNLRLVNLNAGNYRVVVQALPNAVSIPVAYAFKLQNASAALELQATDSLTNAQTAIGADIYKISVQAGQRILLQVAELNGWPGTVSVFNANGQKIISDSLLGTTLDFGTDTNPQEFLIVIDSGFSSTNLLNYTLGTELISVDINPAVIPLAIDSIIDTQLNAYGLLNYQFDLTEPTDLWLEALNTVSGLNWRIEDAQGVVVYSGAYDVAQSRRISLASGSYIFRYKSLDYTTNVDTAIFFKLANLNTPALPLNLDETTNGTLSAYGLLNYQFTVNTPTMVWLDAISGPNGVDWQLEDAQGNSVYSGTFAIPQVAPISLAAGSYTLKYRALDALGNANAAIAFKLADISYSALPIVSGERVQGTLSAGNSLVAYQFDASQFDTFQLKVNSATSTTNNT
ncbi:MAG: LEPR-XLL domain-containing protein, partial [Methylobacter sp.]|nr:LEPR-XLL domain-containing protein [Methylobacter sp.]